LTTRRLIAGGLVAAAAAAVAGLLSCGGPTARPNLILITLDTTRADRLGCYGHEPALTPTLDSLAVQGVLFEQAFSSVPVTLPSHSTIMTGLLPTRHGVRDNGTFILGDEFLTLAEILSENGYQTGAFVSAFVLSEADGIAQGFTTYDDRFYTERPAMLTSRRAARWLARIDPSRPFFLWLHYYDPHIPRDPPEPFRRMDHLDVYDQEVAAMDAGLGHFLRELRESGLDRGTDLLIIGDHGEGLGDHDEPEHGIFLYDATIRVPLIWVPSGEAGPRSGTETRVTGTVDVAPTLLDRAGVPIPEGLDGRSLLPLLEGKDEGEDPPAYAETYFTAYNFYHSQIFMLRTERWKYIDAPRPELYHVKRDPGELRDLFKTFPDTARALKGILDVIRNESDTSAARSSTLTAEEIERLQSLGYLGGGQLAMEMDVSGEFILPDPKDMKPYAKIFAEGLNALTEGRPEDGAALLEEVLAQNPENVITRLNLGKLYRQLGRFEEAAHHLEQAVVLSPKSATCKRNLGLAYQKLGRYEDALEVLGKILDDPTQGIIATMEMARTRLYMGEPEECQLILRDLADRHGGAAEISALASRVGDYIRQRDASETDPEDQEARLQLASSALDLSLVSEAESALRFRGSTAMLEARRHQLLGSIAGTREDYETARAEYEKALPMMSHDPYVRSQLVALYLEAEDPDAALALAEELIREGSATPVVYYNKACALALSGRVEEAFGALLRAVRRGYSNMEGLQKDPDIETLRTDARFLEILEIVGEETAAEDS